jgi:hypothetical protein
MKLIDLVYRPVNSAPWEEGDNIPWHEPAFSTRCWYDRRISMTWRNE